MIIGGFEMSPTFPVEKVANPKQGLQSFSYSHQLNEQDRKVRVDVVFCRNITHTLVNLKAKVPQRNLHTDSPQHAHTIHAELLAGPSRLHCKRHS
jgi:hypothetical protein